MSRGWAILALVAAACAPVYSASVPSGTIPPEALLGESRAERARDEAPRRSRPAAEPGPDVPARTARLAAVLETLVWPLALDRATLLSSTYGDRDHPRGGGVRFHAGLDLRAPAGTPVYAAADGVVLRSEAGGAYGNYVLVDHGEELASLYAHHSQNLVRAGNRVRRGEVIALVGRTGNATGDHLHFELRWRGGTVDPRVVLPRLRSP